MMDFVTYKMWYFAVISLVLVCSSYCQLTTSNTRKCVTKEIHYNTYEKDCKPACGYGWYYFKNKCYFIKESEFYTYDEAETLCQGMDSQLVIIKDAELDLFLREFGSRTSSVWIGITDREVEGTFRWSDNTPLTYSNWSPPQPDNSKGIEDYGQLNREYGGQWNDKSCESKQGFVCQKEYYQ